jgi:hypothetical protein
MSEAPAWLFAAWFTTLPVAVFAALVASGGRRGRAFTAGCLGLLAAGLAGDARELAFQRDLAGWRPLPGRVVVSERGARQNEWRFEYEYEVDGARRRGSVFTHRPRLRSRADTDRLFAEHPVGREITVFVDPGDPARAALDARPGFGLAIAGFAIHAALGLALWRGAARARRPDPSPGGVGDAERAAGR